jgi:hypothetical protein
MSEAPSGPLYTILPERKVDRVAGQMMASTHVYELAVCLVLVFDNSFVSILIEKG